MEGIVKLTGVFTLDETIETLKKCMFEKNCQTCFFNDESGCQVNYFVIHFLKNYQTLSKMWNDKLDKEHINPPLTWNKLRNMIGKPVWIESGENKEHCRWFVIDQINNNRMMMIIKKEKKTYMRNGIGKDWNAYIKENV